MSESRADRDPARRCRQRDGARASWIVRVEAGRAREPLERLGPFEPAVHPQERVERFERGQRCRLPVLDQDPLDRRAQVVQLAAQLVPRGRELRAHEYRLPFQEHRRVVTRVPLAGARLVGR